MSQPYDKDIYLRETVTINVKVNITAEFLVGVDVEASGSASICPQTRDDPEDTQLNLDPIDVSDKAKAKITALGLEDIMAGHAGAETSSWEIVSDPDDDTQRIVEEMIMGDPNRYLHED